jgi:RHS repeat-associated protein
MLTDSGGHPIGNITFDAFGNGGASGAGMIEYTGQERDSANAPAGRVPLPDYFHARLYEPSMGRFLSIDKHAGDTPRPQSWNRYVFASNNPLVRIDPDGLRDIYIAFWHSQFPYLFGKGSVGHVGVFEMNHRVILSQFPSSHFVTGANTTLPYIDTVQRENRLPDAVFKVFVPDDKGFDAKAATEQADAHWDMLPAGGSSWSETNCVDSVGKALDAGGVPIYEPDRSPGWPSTPGQLEDKINQLMNGPPNQPWSVKSVPANTLGTPPTQPDGFWSTLFGMLL